MFTKKSAIDGKNLIWGFYICYYKQFFYRSMKKQLEEWVAWAKEKKRFIVFYRQRALDLTEFIKVHPGGRKSLENYAHKDVAEVIFTVYPHKKESTINTLFKYVVGVNTSYGSISKKQGQNSKSVSKRSKSKKKVCFRNSIVQDILLKGQNNENHIGNEDSVLKNHSAIKKSIRQRNNYDRKNGHDKHEVSIKLIAESEIQDYMNMVNQKNNQKQEKRKLEQLDRNIETQDLQQSTIVSKMPVMKVQHINH